MAKEFKTLRGYRVYLEIPPQKKSEIIVDENTKKALLEAFTREMTKAKVYAVGDIVTDIEVGDLVLVEPTALMRAPTIELSKDRSVLLVSAHDITHIW